MQGALAKSSEPWGESQGVEFLRRCPASIGIFKNREKMGKYRQINERQQDRTLCKK